MLQPEDFTAFFQEVHGHAPFPWQRDLPKQVVDHGGWPDMIDIPTGLGKTAMIDVGIFMAALDADRPAPDRLGRRRIFFVVDRRLVVDQAAMHASRIADALASATPGSVCEEVARRITSFGASNAEHTPVPVVTMRGGISWDAAWLSRPDLPAIVTGTVDQVGSRLFFRGYGVSDWRRPIDAALVGTDSLILVDEAHLATALTTTLQTATAYDRPTRETGSPRPILIQLSATAPSHTQGWTNEFDAATHLEHPVASRRITAEKLLSLEACSKAATAKTLSGIATREASEAGSRVLVVCNTIAGAREVHTLLTKSLPPSNPPLLLIGRSRPYEREEVVRQMLDLFGAERDSSDGTAVLVATQTVEVGVDLDASCLVTEGASWDALVQRIGRVNRRGAHQGKVVVVEDDDEKPPVYGAAKLATMQFLRELVASSPSGVDVSPLALRKLTPPATAWMARPHVPDLLQPHLDAWVRTAPSPVNDAPLDPYLHGIDRSVAPVSVAWRDGLLLEDGSPIADRPADISAIVDTIPVRAEETVDVPLTAFRRWLMGDSPIPVSDWDVEDDWAAFGDDQHARALRRVAQPDGTADWSWVTANGIRPGDTLVVPSELGGLDEYGWAPSHREQVRDVAELAALDRGQPLLRVDEGLPQRLGLEEPTTDLWRLVRSWQAADAPETRDELSVRCTAAIRTWLAGAKAVGPSPLDRAGARPGGTRREQLLAKLDGASLETPAEAKRARNSHQMLSQMALLCPSRESRHPWREATDERSDGTAHLEQRVGLADHGAAVGRRATDIAERLGLPDSIIGAVEDAARWHDLGKADPRFQAMLFDGDAIQALLAAEPLAKSGMPPGDLRRHRDARRLSKLPVGARHEAWSHALVSAFLSDREDYAADKDLVLHLVASHHGRARPLLPPVEDHGQHQLRAHIDGREVTAELPTQVDLEHASRFQELNRRYGRWGLALLETILRCADMTVSGEGS